MSYDQKALQQDIENIFISKNKHSKYSFKGMQSQIISGLSKHLIDWMSECFTKYPEAEFHARMAKTYAIKDARGNVFKLNGFDFIGDWKKNHAKSFKTFVFGARRFKESINLDEDSIVAVITRITQGKGWKLSPSEMLGIRQTANRLKNIIYYNIDTISLK